MKKQLYVFFGVLIFAVASTVSCANRGYTRAECITKAKIHWPNDMSTKEREKVIDEIFLRETQMRNSGYKAPIAGFGVRYDDRSEFYIQYRDACESKQEMTIDFFDRVARKIGHFPRYEILDEAVAPHPKTIDIRGPYWKDGLPLHDPKRDERDVKEQLDD